VEFTPDSATSSPDAAAGEEQPGDGNASGDASDGDATDGAAGPISGSDGRIGYRAAAANISVDGDISDWNSIDPVSIPLEQIRIDDLDPGDAEDVEFDPLPEVDATLRVAADADNIYLLMEVADDYDFDPEDHNLSPSLAIQFLIDPDAAVHMGSPEDDLDTSLGVVDMWHWELDCGPGEITGGGGIAGGDDSVCNFDDEYATTPEDREDDDTAEAENSLVGVWEHTGRDVGEGADGVWIFEMSRPLQTGDLQDVQFASGATSLLALAYFDPDESTTGWSDAGHLTSSYVDWIEVILP
jgi:hypothetical protein